jgi:hypothetical protein
MPKVGKTTALAALPGCLLLDLEANVGGTDHVEALKVSINNRADFEAVITELKATNSNGERYPFVAIDTLSRLEEFAEERATADYCKSPIGKSFAEPSVLTLPQGGGYYWLREALKRYIHDVFLCAPHVIMTAHVLDKVVVKAGKDVVMKDLDLIGKNKSIVGRMATATGYMYRSKEGLMVSFLTYDEDNMGGRCAHLKGKQFSFAWPTIYPFLKETSNEAA